MAKTKAETGRAANAKGGRFEREVCRAFKLWWGCEWIRTTLHHGVTKRNIPGDVAPVNPETPFPFSVELKSQEDLVIDPHLRHPEASQLSAAFTQALADLLSRSDVLEPLLLVKRRNAGVLAFYPSDVELGIERALIRWDTEAGPYWWAVADLNDLVEVQPLTVVDRVRAIPDRGPTSQEGGRQ